MNMISTTEICKLLYDSHAEPLPNALHANIHSYKTWNSQAVKRLDRAAFSNF